MNDDFDPSPVPGMTCDEHMEQYLHAPPYRQHSIRNFIKTVLYRLQCKEEPCGGVLRRDDEHIQVEFHLISQADGKPTLFFP